MYIHMYALLWLCVVDMNGLAGPMGNIQGSYNFFLLPPVTKSHMMLIHLVGYAKIHCQPLWSHGSGFLKSTKRSSWQPTTWSKVNLEQTINAAVYPDIRAELPGVNITSHDETHQMSNLKQTMMTQMTWLRPLHRMQMIMIYCMKID